MALPTVKDFEQFHKVNSHQRCSYMTLYLIDGYNMDDVGQRVDGTPTSFTTSMVHRCYGFSGNNSGVYGPKGAFYKKYKFYATPQDVSAFVHTHPNGLEHNAFPNQQGRLETEFARFLLARQNATNTQQISSLPQQSFQQNIQQKSPQQSNTPSKPNPVVVWVQNLVNSGFFSGKNLPKIIGGLLLFLLLLVLNRSAVFHFLRDIGIMISTIGVFVSICAFFYEWFITQHKNPKYILIGLSGLSFGYAIAFFAYYFSDEATPSIVGLLLFTGCGLFTLRKSSEH